jgi:hypothetical protein
MINHHTNGMKLKTKITIKVEFKTIALISIQIVIKFIPSINRCLFRDYNPLYCEKYFTFNKKVMPIKLKLYHLILDDESYYE